MEYCSYCRRPAKWFCAKCETRVCTRHLKPRYAGPYRGISRYMCPCCNNPIEDLLRVAQREGKLYVFIEGIRR